MIYLKHAKLISSHKKIDDLPGSSVSHSFILPSLEGMSILQIVPSPAKLLPTGCNIGGKKSPIKHFKPHIAEIFPNWGEESPSE